MSRADSRRVLVAAALLLPALRPRRLVSLQALLLGVARILADRSARIVRVLPVVAAISRRCWPSVSE
jgi:hypothetical protein